MKPALLVIAGPNGSGKTTITERLQQERWSEGVEYINPDIVARDRFGDWNSREAVEQAARCAGRVMAGGHTVPIEKIITRYSRAMMNLSAAFELADRVYVYDNSVEDVEAMLCARTADGMLRKIYGALPQWIDDAVRPLARHPEFVDARAA